MSKQSNFWDKEYADAKHLSLSDEPAEDLEKFVRYLVREHGKKLLNVTTQVLDLGSGNGRNLVYLAKEFGMRGIGYDTSRVAVEQAKKASEGMQIQYEVRSMADPLPLPNTSVTIVLDMMSSHFLKKEEREALRAEILRVLKPGGWLFFKSFLLDDDSNARRLLRDNPAEEPGMYIHPEIGVAEYVWTEEALREFFEPHFTIHNIDKSFKHRREDGSSWKRRTIVAYLEKN